MSWTVNAQAFMYYSHKDDYPTAVTPPPITTELRVWLDMSQETGLTDGSTFSPMTDWDSVYGPYDFENTTGAYQPIYDENTPEGGAAADFDGSDDRMQPSNPNAPIIPGNSHVSVYLVFHYDAPSTAAQRVFSLNPSVGAGMFIQNLNINAMQVYLRVGGGSFITAHTMSPNLGNKVLLYVMVDNSAGSIVVGDKSSETTNSFTNNLWTTYTIFGSTVGADRSGQSNFFNGQVYEVLVYYDDHNSSERTSIKNYLINKHGL